MPKLRNAYAAFGKTSIRAGFVVSLMLFNVVLSTLSSAVAYAETGEEAVVETATVQQEEVTVETQAEEQVVNEDTPEEISTEEETTDETVVDEVTEEAAEEEPAPEPEVVAAVEEVEEIVELLPTPETEVVIDCWVRTSLTEYTMTVTVTSDTEIEFMQGGPLNNTDPTQYESLVPDSFKATTDQFLIEGWDGETFEWTLNGQVVEVSLEEDRCEGPTILDIIAGSPDHTILAQAVLLAGESRQCSKLVYSLGSSETDGGLTVFAPTDAAFMSLVGSPASVNGELFQLGGNVDELCALIASHVIVGEVVSTDVTEAGVTVYTIFNDVDGIFVQLVGTSVLADGYTNINPVDLFAVNGVVHVSDQVILPQSVGTINPIVTDKTSPALSGSINTPMMSSALGEEYTPYGYCVVVRVDGMPYVADVSGATWSIAEGVVMLNPTKSDTLFDVVVRTSIEGSCDSIIMDDIPNDAVRAQMEEPILVRSGGMLLGLTMNRGVLSFLEPEVPIEEPEEQETGEVLGTTDVPVAPSGPVVVAASTCGKGVCGDVAQADPSTIDSDGDGVVDSEDPAPFDANITGAEDDVNENDSSDQANNNQDDEEGSDNDNAVYWWFLLGGGATVGAYMYRQRNGAPN